MTTTSSILRRTTTITPTTAPAIAAVAGVGGPVVLEYMLYNNMMYVGVAVVSCGTVVPSFGVLVVGDGTCTVYLKILINNA